MSRLDLEPIPDEVYLYRTSQGLIVGCESAGACKVVKYVRADSGENWCSICSEREGEKNEAYTEL